MEGSSRPSGRSHADGSATDTRARRRRDRGDDGISWDKINKCYVGTISLGYDAAGKRIRRTRARQDQGRGQGQARQAARRDQRRYPHARDLHRRAVRRATGSTILTLDPRHHGQLPRPGREMDLPEDRRDASSRTSRRPTPSGSSRTSAKVLGKRSLMMIKSTLRRSIRRAQKHDLIGRNVAELVDLPEGQPGRPSRAMTEEQAGKVLATASGHDDRLRQGRQGRADGQDRATHAATEDRRARVRHQAAQERQATEISTDLRDATCRACRAQLGLDARRDTTAGWRRCSSCPSRSACALANCAG